MSNNVTIPDYILREAAEEIENLRARNREQATRLRMFDDCMLLMNSRDGRGSLTGAMFPDIVLSLRAILSSISPNINQTGSGDLKEPQPGNTDGRA